MKQLRTKLTIPIHYFPVIIAPILLFAPVWLTGKTLFWGTPFLQFMPWRVLGWSMILSGHLPLWNPWVGMGAPLLANLQSAFFYPPNWLLFALDSIGGIGWMAWGQTIIVILHLIWSGIGMMVMARQLGLNRLAQTIGALSYSLSGYLVARAGFLSINAAVAWLPWIMVAAYRLSIGSGKEIKPRRNKYFSKEIFILALLLGMQLLAGHAQTSYYTVLLTITWIIFWSYQSGRWKSTGINLVRLGLAMILGVGLAAIQLIPTGEYLMQSQRSTAVGYDFAMNYSFLPFRFLTLISPNLFGSPAFSGYLTSSDNYWEDAIYVGFLPFLLAVVALYNAIRRSRSINVVDNKIGGNKNNRLALFLGLITLVVFILALGKYTPVFPFLYRYIPTFNLFQAPTRFMLLAEFGLSLLAAIGINQWHRPEGKSLSWIYRGIVVACAFIVAAGGGWLILKGVKPAMIEGIAFIGVAGVICGVLTLMVTPTSSQINKLDNWSWIVIVIVSGDLILAGYGLNPGASQELYTQPSPVIPTLTSLLNGHRLYINSADENNLKFNRFFIFNNLNILEPWQNLRSVLLPDSTIMDNIASANNFDPLLPDRYVQWMDALEKTDPNQRSNMLSLMDVAAVEIQDKTKPSGVSFTPYNGANRIRWFNCVIPATNAREAWDETMSLVNSEGKGKITSKVILEGVNSQQQATCDSAYHANLQVMRQDPGSILINVISQQEGWLMLADTWYPGWKAFVDGKAEPIYRADYLFRGITVPSGIHQVKFVYQPTSLSLGAVITIITLFINFVFILFTHYNQSAV